MDWCLQSFEEANHPPVPLLNKEGRLSVKSGEEIFLDASKSTDPDNDNLSYLWFNYTEAGTLKEELKIGGSENSNTLNVQAPKVTKKETIHFILKVTDKGSPTLSRYKRIIIDILPK
jgi:hypothetical protein